MTRTRNQVHAFPNQSRRPAVNPSIRDQLEREAWLRYPTFAARVARRRPRPETRRRLRWQDRTRELIGKYRRPLEDR